MDELGELILSDTIDDRDRGPYTIIESTAVDGNVADVYGEFPEESAERAEAIVNGMNELPTLRAENARLTAELAAARDRWKTFVGMMGPIADDCLCMDEPDNDQGENDPSNHSQYCPIYLQAYAEAMANGTEVPE